MVFNSSIFSTNFGLMYIQNILSEKIKKNSKKKERVNLKDVIHQGVYLSYKIGVINSYFHTKYFPVGTFFIQHFSLPILCLYVTDLYFIFHHHLLLMFVTHAQQRRLKCGIGERSKGNN